ncbi:MAG: DEAD/DEAH box helicase [Acidobacteria bacterium]|nr:DEAD/DEAH box helicase [Acidobacteriota bacterium]
MTVPAAHNKKVLPEWVPPALTTWFHANFAAATQTQQLAWRRTFHGGNVLVFAPAGSGKTVSAFFSVLAQLGARANRGKLPNAVLAVYITPFRTLGSDIRRNLEEPLAALNATLPRSRRIRMEIRTGGIAHTSRRPHLLVTTPESLSALLSRDEWREVFEPEIVVVDDLHAIAESKRGSLLALTLERLHARAPHTLQRIGLSAAAQPAEAMAQLLCGRRTCSIVSDSIRRMHRLEIQVPAHLPPAGSDPTPISGAVIEAVRQARTTLAFTATPFAAEQLGLAVSQRMPEDEDHQLRILAAAGFSDFAVNYSGVEQVLLLGTPRSVSGALQRLARNGQRMGGVAFGRIVPLNVPDLLEAFALRQAVLAGYIEDVVIPQAPLDVLAQCLPGMGDDIEQAWELVRSAGPYLHLARRDFDRVLAGAWTEDIGVGGHIESLSTRMVEEELRLRHHMRAAWSEGGRPRVESILREVYQATMQQAELAGEFVARQYQAAPIPIDSPVQFEFISHGVRRILIVHCVAGRAVNESLARVVSHRLGQGASIAWGSDDHGHLLVLDPGVDASEAVLRRAYNAADLTADVSRHAQQVFEAGWEIFEHTRPSPFALPLFKAFDHSYKVED